MLETIDDNEIVEQAINEADAEVARLTADNQSLRRHITELQMMVMQRQEAMLQAQLQLTALERQRLEAELPKVSK